MKESFGLVHIYLLLLLRRLIDKGGGVSKCFARNVTPKIED